MLLISTQKIQTWSFICCVITINVLAMLPNRVLGESLESRAYSVEVSAVVQKSPPKITLSWPQIPNSATFPIYVYRKAPDATSWGTLAATLAGDATSYVDTNVAVGTVYEYRITQNTGRGYITTGVEVPLVENRGKVILLVDNTYAAALAAELMRLEQDLTGDGWTVIRRDVARNETVPNVKAVVKAVYVADPANVKALFIFGHVPVPYSGQIAPDGHGDHVGAWGADVYYGDMDGVWTDTSVNVTTASRPENRNIPGDGKFDQSSIPSDVELEVGRVDLANMPAFAPKTELDLLRQYLNKDHNFRSGLLPIQRRGLVDDNFGAFGGEAFGASGWRNFSTFFGAANVESRDWFTTLNTQGYLWAYGCGGGNYQGAGGVGSTSNFASTDTKAVFTMLFGSYFGDWDSTNNFLRAPLATTTYGLTDAWAGRPGWQFHQMALGQNIGYSARLAQNDTGALYNYGRSIHIALMGDPTLRMHPVVPPTNLTATKSGNNIVLQWSASPDAAVGYNVYRRASSNGSFARLTTNPTPAISFTDSNAVSGNVTYMVRAIKLESSASGSYFNASQGIFKDTAKSWFDFDGDGKADLSVFRPANNTWYLQRSTAGLAALQFGANGDLLAPADFDGDGKTDVAVYRSGSWYLMQSSNNQFRSVSFGQAGDKPVPADYDGDGRADVAVWRPSNGAWYVYNLATSQFTSALFGQPGDKPVPADYDGDGKVNYAVFRPSDGVWYVAKPTGVPAQNFNAIPFGISTDTPVPGDYDGDGKADQAVYRNGTWYILRSSQGYLSYQFGLAADLPVAADYDGDGKTDLAVFRAGNWYLQESTGGFVSSQFGLATDKPVPNAFVP